VPYRFCAIRIKGVLNELPKLKMFNCMLPRALPHLLEDLGMLKNIE
jgi:hypothetical protein